MIQVNTSSRLWKHVQRNSFSNTKQLTISQFYLQSRYDKRKINVLNFFLSSQENHQEDTIEEIQQIHFLSKIVKSISPALAFFYFVHNFIFWGNLANDHKKSSSIVVRMIISPPVDIAVKTWIKELIKCQWKRQEFITKSAIMKLIKCLSFCGKRENTFWGNSSSVE